MKKLNLACGKDIKKGYINVDNFKWEDGVDVIHDLNVLPLPFENDSCDEVILSHILEHLPDYPALIEDLYRVCKKGAIIKITVPHLASRNAWNDPTHIRFFIERTFHYFVEDGTVEHNPWHGRKWHFNLNRCTISFGSWWWMKPIEWLINRFPGFYENHLMFILQPAHIYAELEVLK